MPGLVFLESALFQAVFVAWSRLYQNSVVASRPPAGNASLWTANQSLRSLRILQKEVVLGRPYSVHIFIPWGDLSRGRLSITGLLSYYHNEISADTTGGSVSLTSGEAITMVNEKGDVLAKPYVLDDYAFKVDFEKSL